MEAASFDEEQSVASMVAAAVSSLPLTSSASLQFWREVVEDTEVRELIWDKSGLTQGERLALEYTGV